MPWLPGIARTITLNMGTSSCTCQSAADDFSMRPCIDHPDWGGAAGPTCSGPSLTMSESATLTVTGGGGDPHMVAPNLPRHLELHNLLEVTSARSVGNLVVTLMDFEASTCTVVMLKTLQLHAHS